MPSKTQTDVNLWFLYTCLQKSDYKTIDFKAVGEATSLNPPAARMRFSRLKKAIEAGATNSITSPERVNQCIGVVGKSKQRCKSSQAKSKGVMVKMENQMRRSGCPGENATMMDREMGIEPHLMVYNQQEMEPNCARGSSEPDSGDTDDDDIPLAVKRKAAQHGETNKKRTKQTDVLCSTEIKDERAIDDKYNGETQNIYNRTNMDEVTAMDGIPSREANRQCPDTHQYSATNESMTLAPPVLTTTHQGMVPGYIAPFTNDNNNQFTSRASEQHDLSHDPYWTSWPSMVSHMTHPHDPPAPRSLSTHTPSYVRSPSIGQSDSTIPWTRYRIPNITITDTDPYGVRNPLYPGSTNSVDKVQMAINEALFSAGSRAFDCNYSGTTEAKDIRRD
ncbi:conserved hypothetical protein [Histoplasma capsulatum H143]|uniref:Myb-like DNA-binding domain-containing protein n=2 Tax=Ajellomyces capsulatus TaxID=5037 RepID=C6H4B3_AJECH|nr:conserved hypothetical protein [Histoplasma capsulatum H143]